MPYIVPGGGAAVSAGNGPGGVPHGVVVDQVFGVKYAPSSVCEGLFGSGGLQNGPHSSQRWASTFFRIGGGSEFTDTCVVILM
jgi:hypothetical protein